MRKLILLALGISAAVLVRRRAAEQGITSSQVIGNALEEAMAWLADAPARLAASPQDAKKA